MTNIAKIFCNGIAKAGYKAGYYCNRNWYYNHLYPTELKNYAFWYARPEVSAPDIKCDIWQNAFGERTGRWNGANISGKGCDTNIAYTTFGATEQPKPQIHYAPKNARFTSDTTTTVYVKQGSQYTAKINCSTGRPKLVAGTGSVAEINFKSQSGTSYYFDIKAIGKVGQCYTVGLKCPDKPTVTLGSSGIATICGVYKSGDKWLCPIVGFNEGVTGVYTSVNREPSIKRFELKISK